MFSPTSRRCFSLMLMLALGGASLLGAPAQAERKSPILPFPVTGVAQDAETVRGILAVLESLLAASNRHDLDAVLSHYASQFHSGDNLSLEQIRKLIEETWSVYPNISYQSQILAVRIHDNWATVESMDTATAITRLSAENNGSQGSLNSRSRGLLYLHKVGKTWRIVSDYTLYEEATILYGKAGDYKVTLSAPDQVFSGDTYSATVNAGIPDGMFAIATISMNPLVYPQRKPDEKFRSIAPERPSLERVFEANTTNNNEIITATVGITRVTQDEMARPNVELQGIATLVKRVNVVPKSTYSAHAALDLVKRSADGKIDLTNAEVSRSAEKSPDTVLEQGAPSQPLIPDGLPPGHDAPPATTPPADSTPPQAPDDVTD